MKTDCTKCYECEHCKRLGKKVFCGHPNTAYIDEYFRSRRMTKMPGFLGFSYKGFPVKTSPAWCPLKAYKCKGCTEHPCLGKLCVRSDKK